MLLISVGSVGPKFLPTDTQFTLIDGRTYRECEENNTNDRTLLNDVLSL
jgi:hypothetical protein